MSEKAVVRQNEQTLAEGVQQHENKEGRTEKEENLDHFDPLSSTELRQQTVYNPNQNHRIGESHQLNKMESVDQSKLKNQKSLFEPYQSRVSLHEQYPTLSKSFHEKQKQKEKFKKSKLENEQPYKKEEQINQMAENQQKSAEDNPTSMNKQQQLSTQKFQQYLNNEIQKLNKDDQQAQIKAEDMLSPIPLRANMSLRSNQSSFYRPQNYSLNLSRSYIPNFISLGNPTIYEFEPIQSESTIQKKFVYIFNYYSQTYLQPTQCYETFDSVKIRTMEFQSFCLFAKDFQLLKKIFSLNTIKKVFKKYSQFGKTLKFSHFMDVINALAHEKESNDYFKLEEMVPGMNAQTRKALEIRQLYAYIGIHQQKQKIKQKFSKVFHAFNCQKDVQQDKLKYNYKRFSETDLHRKAVPEQKQRKSKNKLKSIKSIEKLQSSSPFEQQKSVVISWNILRSKSTQNLDTIKFSANKVRKYVKEDPEDKLYLKQYKQLKKKTDIKSMIGNRVKSITSKDQNKSHQVLKRLEQLDQKLLSSKLRLENRLSKTKI